MTSVSTSVWTIVAISVGLGVVGACVGINVGAVVEGEVVGGCVVDASVGVVVEGAPVGGGGRSSKTIALTHELG